MSAMSTKTDFQGITPLLGDFNTVVEGSMFAGRDIHFNNIKNVVGSEEPRHIQMSGYQADQYIEPLFLEQLLTTLKKKRLLVLHGNPQFRKGALVKQLAWRLWKEDQCFACMELLPTSERGFHLLRQLEEATRPAIMLMELAQPTDLPGSPAEVRRLAGSSHYVIAWTDHEPGLWGLEGHEEAGLFWEVPMQVEYPRGRLEQYLLGQLNQHAANIQFEEAFAKRLFGSHQDAEVGKMTALLKSLESIWHFIQLMEAQGTPVDETRMRDLAEEAHAASATSLRKWFTLSDEKNRLLLTSAALFSGLRNDQFFRAFDSLVHNHWKHRVPSLMSVDYCDFDSVAAFFQFEESEAGESYLTNVSSEEESKMLELAWKGYRRHLEWVIPQLVLEIRDSVGNGHRFFAVNLRRQLGLTLARLGALHQDLVAQAVDTLASDEKPTLRRVAARIMAEWHRQHRDDLFEQTALRWLGNEAEDTWAKDTLCQCLKYAANYETHNQLSDALLKWTDRMVSSPVAAVQKNMLHWLPTIICNHAVRLAPILKTDWLRKRNQTIVVAKGLAQAYAYWPKETREIITDWLQDAGEAISSTGIGDKLTHRDRVLLAACIAMSNVAGLYPEIISRGMAVQEFRHLLRQESQATVRASLVRLMLQAVLNTTSFPEADLVGIWTEQREDDRNIMFDHLKQLLPGCGYQFTPETAQGLAKLRKMEMADSLRAGLLASCIEVLRQLDPADMDTFRVLLTHPLPPERVNAYRAVGAFSLAEEWPWKQELFQLLLSLIPQENDPGAKGSAIAMAIQLVQGPTPFSAEEIVTLFLQCDFGTKITLMETLINLLGNGQFSHPERLLEMARTLYGTASPIQRKNLREGLHKALAKCSVAQHQFAVEMILLWSMDMGFAADQELGFFLAEMHVHQRAAMQGGTFSFPHLGLDIPVFMGGRALTHTETILLNWMNGNQPHLRQVAILGFLEISKWLGLAEQQQRMAYVPQPPPVAPAQSPAPTPSDPQGGGPQPTNHIAPMQPIPAQHQVPARMQAPPYPADPTGNLPLGLRIRVWLMLFFQPSSKKAAWKSALLTLFLTPYHERAQILHTLRTWQQMKDPNLPEMAGFLLRAFRHIHKP
jgi:hypothetical protein